MNRHDRLDTLAFISCPFCAMVCDDLSLPVHNEALTAQQLPCEKARMGFTSALQATRKTPRINGKETTWKQALQLAGEMLREARLPLFHGLIGDLLDSKAAVKMADHFGGVIDHLHGDAIARNLQIYQQGGWQVSSMGEVRNRADLVVLIGYDPQETYPRLHEKLLDSTERLHTKLPPIIHPLNHDCLDLLLITRARLAGKPVQSDTAGSNELLTRITGADYPVFIIGRLPGKSAELIIRTCVGLVRDINETRRSALLMLGAGEGDTTAQLSAAWHNGFGIRTCHAKGYPEQDLQMYAGSRLMQSAEADLLVWISSLSCAPPPDVAQKTIVIGHPAISFTQSEPAIFLPTGVPGIHRSGYLHRADGLRLVPLKRLIDSPLPSSATLCEQLISQEPRTC